ncbi:MAG: hypothetical protein FLDDKLPJ_03491 [Phycisphaerae bacterium]|nr:hypothetical protein [Phycisphaerae bacterium]
MMTLLAQGRGFALGDILEIVFFIIIVVLPMLGAVLRRRSGGAEEPDSDETLRRIIEEERRKMNESGGSTGASPPHPRPASPPQRPPAAPPSARPQRPPSARPTASSRAEAAAQRPPSAPTAPRSERQVPPPVPSRSSDARPHNAPRGGREGGGSRSTRRRSSGSGAPPARPAEAHPNSSAAKRPGRLEEQLRTRQVGSDWIGGAVSRAEGETSAPEAGGGPPPRIATFFSTELSLDELRKAVILSEVLAPPLALREGR